MESMTQGRRATLELCLSDAERDLATALGEHNDLMVRADVQSALACEPGRNGPRYNLAAASLRFRAFAMRGDIADARERVKTFKAKLAEHSTSVELTAEQCRAVDDTAGLQEAAI